MLRWQEPMVGGRIHGRGMMKVLACCDKQPVCSSTIPRAKNGIQGKSDNNVR
jgi:hypothetical protein